MWNKLVTVFRIPELRQKIFLTLVLLFVYRMGFVIPLPVINQEALHNTLAKMQDQTDGLSQALRIAEIFSASSFGMSTIFGLGIMPYISASIILQLMATVYPPLEKLSKEGESGRKKINEYTRYATVLLCFGQSLFWINYFGGQGGQGGESLILSQFVPTEGTFADVLMSWSAKVVMASVMTAGTVFLMWIGEQIDEYGIGNGISLLIMSGILARMPNAIGDMFKRSYDAGMGIGGQYGVERIFLMLGVFLGVIVCVIAITQGQRRIPTQSAKHVRGRRVWGGQKHYLPLRVNQSGVMPIIFASSLLMFPSFIFQQLASLTSWRWMDEMARAFSSERGYIYSICYIILIYFFCYFWTAITFNPKDMAKNLQDMGSFIPGQRPGKRTAEYLEKVMVRITYVGAAFLAVIAVIPTLVSGLLVTDVFLASFFGGTSLLIVVSVGLDLIQKIDSHLVMRSYSGLLEG